jgi:hypothetical protein
MTVSSDDLHPASGARFVFRRQGDSVPLVYRVNVYLPDAVRQTASLVFAEDGSVAVDPALLPPWVAEEAIKLARVLKRTGQSTMSRWRSPP